MVGVRLQDWERLFEFSRAAIAAQSQEDVWQHLKKSLEGFGVKWLNYAAGPPDELVFFSNMTPEWARYYLETYAASDHLIDHIARGGKPLFLDGADFTGKRAPEGANREMMQDLWDQQARGGICLPFAKEAPDHMSGASLFFGLSEADTRAVMARDGEEITLICTMAHQFLRQHVLQSGPEVYSAGEGGRAMDKMALLTGREKEVLLHLMRGLRPDRIAEIMNLSVPTVNLHIRKARRRLGAATREELVAKALISRQLVL